MERKSRSVMWLAALSFAAVLALPVLAPAAAMTFKPAVAVATDRVTGEPGIAIDPTNASRIYVVAPGVNGVWRSTDGGSSFSLSGFGNTGASNDGDSDVAVDANGVVYQSGLTDGVNSTIPVSVSTDQGSTWTRVQRLKPNAAGIECDRQWTAAKGAGIVVHAARCGSDEIAWQSTNAGVSFTSHTIATGVSAAGPLVFASNGILYQPYLTASQIRVAKSTTNGASWTSAPVSSYSGDIMFWPGLDVDSAGNVYVAWSESPYIGNLTYPVPPSRGTVFFSKSTNGGSSFTGKQAITPTNRTAVFPWVTAGGTGKVDVSFYITGSTATGGAESPDLGTPLTTWNVEVAQMINGTSFSAPMIAAAGFHTGSICTEGLFCLGPQNLGLGNVPTPFDRRVLDFFETADDPSGNLMIVFPKDLPITAEPIASAVDIMFVSQLGGDKIRP